MTAVFYKSAHIDVYVYSQEKLWKFTLNVKTDFPLGFWDSMELLFVYSFTFSKFFLEKKVCIFVSFKKSLLKCYRESNLECRGGAEQGPERLQMKGSPDWPESGQESIWYWSGICVCKFFFCCVLKYSHRKIAYSSENWIVFLLLLETLLWQIKV